MHDDGKMLVMGRFRGHRVVFENHTPGEALPQPRHRTNESTGLKAKQSRHGGREK